MIKHLCVGILMVTAMASPGHAQLCTSFPDTLTNGTTADATQVMADFNYLGNCAAPLAGPSFSGNVGIGTASPGTALDLNGALSTRGMAAPAVSPAGQGRIYFDSTLNTFQVSQNGGAYTSLVGGGGSSQWSNGSGGAIYYNGGNVGIGTASPSNLLGVYNNASVGDTASAGQVYIKNAYTTGGSGHAAVDLDKGSSAAGAVVDFNTAGTWEWDLGTIGDNNFEIRDGSTNTKVVSIIQGAPANTLYITSSGYVGLGTTTPVSPQNVQANAAGSAWNLSQVTISGSSNSNMRLALGYDTTDNLGFIQAGDNGVSYEPLILNAAGGSVGIGTTTPGSTLDVNGSIQMDGNQQLDATGELYIRTSANYPIVIAPNYTSGPSTAQFTNGGFSLGQGYSATTPPSNGAIIQGDVGIGTTSPGQLLEVNGTAKIDTGLIVPLIYPASNGTTAIQIDEANGTTNVVNIDTTNGRVGIGNTAPAHLLHVGSSSASGIVVEFQNSSGACTHSPTSSSETVSCSSDARLKKDIVDASAALPALTDMRIRDFTVRATGERRTGVIAQEMLTKHADMVHVGRDGLYSVDEPNPWKLVKAIQELKGDNDDLRDKIRSLVALRGENAALKAKLTDTNRRLDVIEAKIGIRNASNDNSAVRTKNVKTGG